MNMIRLIAIGAATLLATTSMAPAQENTPAQQMPTTTAPSAATTLDPAGFAKEAAAANEFEIMSSEVALRRSQASEVKQFAETMINDHRRAQDELQAAAKSDSVNLSLELSMEQKQTLQALEQAEESQFDSAYMSAQMKAHDQAIALLGSYADKGAAGALKTWATAHYPTVRTHRVRAESLTSP
jgi:putative membrane protein